MMHFTFLMTLYRFLIALQLNSTAESLELTNPTYLWILMLMFRNIMRAFFARQIAF